MRAIVLGLVSNITTRDFGMSPQLATRRRVSMTPPKLVRQLARAPLIEADAMIGVTNMLRAEDVGWGWVFIGLAMAFNSGVNVDARGFWFMLGLVLVLYGVVLIYRSKPKP